jgi:hypothetical protein
VGNLCMHTFLGSIVYLPVSKCPRSASSSSPLDMHQDRDAAKVATITTIDATIDAVKTAPLISPPWRLSSATCIVAFTTCSTAILTPGGHYARPHIRKCGRRGGWSKKAAAKLSCRVRRLPNTQISLRDGERDTLSAMYQSRHRLSFPRQGSG